MTFKDFVVKVIWANGHFELVQFDQKHQALTYYWMQYTSPFTQKVEYVEYGYTKMINGIPYHQPTFEVI